MGVGSLVPYFASTVCATAVYICTGLSVEVRVEVEICVEVIVRVRVEVGIGFFEGVGVDSLGKIEFWKSHPAIENKQNIIKTTLCICFISIPS